MLCDLVYRLRPNPKKLHPGFLVYWLLSAVGRAQIVADSRGSSQSMVKIAQGHIRSWQAPVPPLEEQRAVATFLDGKTAAIDALIAKKERLIQLLQEKRQALITQAVTKGLDPGVPMKDSGSPVLGKIPAHWSMKRLKHVVDRIVDCPHSTPEYEDDGPGLVVRTADIDWGRLRIEQMRRCSLSTYGERSERMTLCAGDVMYSREGERFGMAAIVPDGYQLCLGQRMMAFRPNRQTDARFLAWALNSSVSYVQVTQDTVGATSPRVNIPTVANLLLARPDLDEQREIANFIEGAANHIDRMSDTTRISIEYLREYRQALITAAVTGKIDVSQHEAV
jgi:type I restriction enzyme S subunit